jgi:hypothetical protein
MFSRHYKTCLSAAVLLLVLLTLASNALAQGLTGSITGTVMDATGATVPGAVVTIRNADNNATRTATSSGAGTFTVTLLHPGNYSMKIDKSGFRVFERSGIALQIDQVAEIDAMLQVVSDTTSITVTSGASILQTEQSSLGLVQDSSQIQNTPLNGRLTLQGLMIFAPGVQGMPNPQDSIPTSGITFSVGSTRRNSYGTLATTLCWRDSSD